MAASAVPSPSPPPPATGAETVEWDLSDLFGAPDDPRLDAALDDAERLAAGFAWRTRGKVAGFTPEELVAVVREAAVIEDLLGRADGFASLRLAQDALDPARGALAARVDERATAIGQDLLPFGLEWAALDDAAADDLLARATEVGLTVAERHHLAAERRYRPHLRTEPEERVLADKRLSGRNSWLRLHDELLGTLEVRLPGRDAPVGLEAALAELGEPDRARRAAAAGAITEALAGERRTLTAIVNAVLLDTAIDDRLRGHDSWLSSRNLDNEASDASVDALVAAVVGRYDIPQRYYALKRRLLGGELADYDRNAALPDADAARIPFADARATVLDAYGSFSPELADLADGFFTGGYVDAALRPGKRGGAFAAPVSAGVHPYVLLNYTATRRDVMTMAHELGHGVHMVLAQKQGHYGHTTPLTVAETASVFGETVTFGRLLAQTTEPKARLGLLCGRIEDGIATVFRQIAMNRFEDAMHTERRASGELSADRLDTLWLETQRAMLGDAVDLSDGYASWWSYIPHLVHAPGYVYAYAYGNLLALAVYARYEAEGPGFVPRYLEMLAAGGSVTPVELGHIVGVDLDDPGFWAGGLDTIARLVDEAEALAG